jgi:pimeloyl-ACP methyl ester carboxylesterase
MGFAANWGKVWPQFQEERQILVFDQRGHGRSAKPTSGYGPADYADDLKGLLDHLGLAKCHIVGHSMGGRVALKFVERYPENSLSLTLEDSGVETNFDRVGWLEGLLGHVPTPFADRAAAKEYFEKNFRDDPLTGSFLNANLETKEDGRLDWRFYKEGMFASIREGATMESAKIFQSLNLPTLVVRGARSAHLPAAEANRMAAARPNVKLITVEGAGHFVHAEQSAAFNAALKEFLAEVEAK